MLGPSANLRASVWPFMSVRNVRQRDDSQKSPVPRLSWPGDVGRAQENLRIRQAVKKGKNWFAESMPTKSPLGIRQSPEQLPGHFCGPAQNSPSRGTHTNQKKREVNQNITIGTNPKKPW